MLSSSYIVTFPSIRVRDLAQVPRNCGPLVFSVISYARAIHNDSGMSLIYRSLTRYTTKRARLATIAPPSRNDKSVGAPVKRPGPGVPHGMG